MRRTTAGQPAIRAAAIGTRSTFATTPKRGLVVRSAEGTRMRGLRVLATPAERRAAVAALLAAAR